MDMTVREATSVLSGIVHNLRAAKRLESALKVVENAEQLVKEAETKKDKLSKDLQETNSRLDAITGEIEREEIRREAFLVETGRIKTEVQADLQKIKSGAETKAIEAEKASKNRIKEAEKVSKLKLITINKNIENREEVLRVVVDKVKDAEGNLASIKKKLG